MHEFSYFGFCVYTLYSAGKEKNSTFFFHFSPRSISIFSRRKGTNFAFHLSQFRRKVVKFRRKVVKFRRKTRFFFAREPLYSNSAVIAWWLQSTSAQIVYLAVKKGKILVNTLLMKIFITNYCHLFIIIIT